MAPRPGVGVAAVAQIAVTHPIRRGFAEYALQQQERDDPGGVLASHAPAPPLSHTLLTAHAARSTGQFNHRPSFGIPGSFRAVPETRDAYHHGLHASTRLW